MTQKMHFYCSYLARTSLDDLQPYHFKWKNVVNDYTRLLRLPDIGINAWFLVAIYFRKREWTNYANGSKTTS